MLDSRSAGELACRLSGGTLLAFALSACSLLAAPGRPAAPAWPSAPGCAIEAAPGAVHRAAGLAGDPSLPEPSSGYRLDVAKVRAASGLVVTAHPLATRAGCEALAAGGTAVDAAIAAQMVLGLVEPQSSGLGGGAFILHYDATTGRVAAYDGRETAPAAARGNDLRWISDRQRTAPLPDPRTSGRSIGVPGTLSVLALAHARHGGLAWSSLMQPAITLARDGFPVSGRLANAIEAARRPLLLDTEAAAYFLDRNGAPRAAGSILNNPAYAETLEALASGGVQAFYRGEIAAAIVASIGAEAGRGPLGQPLAITPGRLSLEDLARYRAVVREPVCSNYRGYRVCGMPPPSSGGIAVAQVLGILERFDLAALRPTAVDAWGGRPTVAAVHLISEAQRLAYADRDAYVADADFVPLPGGRVAPLIAPAYLASRAALIRADASMGTARPGHPLAEDRARLAPSSNEGHGTSQLSIVDAAGNAVSMTTTIESSLGAYRFTRGFLLNNELTDFSPEPEIGGLPVANRLEGGKRPRSSMAPTLVFRRGADSGRPQLMMVTGSPGGAAIIPFVIRTLVGVLDWGLDAQQASAQVNFGTMNLPLTLIGGEHPAIDARDDGRGDPLVRGLQTLGHRVVVTALTSGVATLLRVQDGTGVWWQAGVDPRRDGLALAGSKLDD